MKNLKSIILLLVFSIFAQAGKSQSCLPDGITFTRQGQIDSFSINYPGCTTIEGNVKISGWNSIADLGGLSSIEQIEGELVIYGNPNLSSLNGLASLTSIGLGLEIDYNHNLVDISSLSNLVSIGEAQDLIISRNESLPNINGLSGLTAIGGKLKIQKNGSLVDLSGLPNVTYIGVVEVTENQALANLDNFLPKVKAIWGSLTISNNKSLSNTDGLSHLETININCTIGSNDSLVSLDLSGVKSIGGVLGIGIVKGFTNYSVGGNPMLADIDLSSLTNVDSSLIVVENHSLTNLDGFSSLVNIKGDLRIGVYRYGSEGNHQLQNLDGLSSLTEVGGSLYIVGNKLLSDIDGLSNLTKVGEDISINRNNSLKNLDGLIGITEVPENLIIANGSLENIDGLGNLSKVGEQLNLGVNWYGNGLSNNKLSNLNGLLNLDSVGRLLLISNPLLENLDGLINLKSISSALIVNGNESLLNIDGLSNVKGESIAISIISNPKLTKLDGLAGVGPNVSSLTIFNNSQLFDLQALSNITAVNYLEIESNSALQNLDGLSNIMKTSTLLIKNNPKLQDLSGLDSLKSADYFRIYHNNNLTSLAGILGPLEIGSLQIEGNSNLPNLIGLEVVSSVNDVRIESNSALINLEGLSTVKSIRNLFIRGNKKLKNLEGLSNLASLIWLKVDDNQHLKSLAGLSTIKNFSGQLFLMDNPILEDISDLEKIDTFVISTDYLYMIGVWIANNPMLSRCDISSICFALANPDIKSIISDNKHGCSSVEEVQLSCDALSVRGRIYYDMNQNKQQDAGEFGVQDLAVSVVPLGFNLLANASGQYYMAGDSGSIYTISLVPNADWFLTTDSASYTIELEPWDSLNQHRDFGVFPNFSQHDVRLSLSSLQTRCNTNVSFFIRYQNQGTFVESGNIILNYDPSSVYLSAEPLPTNIDTVNHTLTWELDSLFPFENREIELVFQMPDESDTGERLSFNAEIYNVNQEVLAGFGYRPLVRCSYDPNDKQVMPPGVRDENYTHPNQKLTYTIRFQNTGNAEAIDVTIRDTLDVDLDISTLRIINSSFPVQASVKGQAVEFFFKNIWLPDSTTNSLESHGFVTYEIKPIEGLADFAEINNTAYIVFDLNPAIVTNTTINTMVYKIPVEVQEMQNTQITILPNPANSVIHILANDNELIHKVFIYNSLGQLVLTQKDRNVDIANLSQGVYLVKVEVGGGVALSRLVVD